MRILPAALTLGVLVSLTVEAHKPITSPYTFAEDVAPILRDRCASCHVAGGPAPMPLTTAEETVPWGESIRLELVAGHMPPWSAISGGKRLRHAEGLTARELNVLLTWVTGGTPPGDAKPAPVAPEAPDWPLGKPDLTLQLPEVAVAADQGEVTREIVLPLDAAARRPLRAVDLKPGTRSLVRSARIAVRSASSTSGSAETIAGLWVPGDQPVALPTATGFAVPSDAEIVVTLRLKKTWEHEREAMSDRSTLALYFADPRATPVLSQSVTAAVSSQTITTPTRLLAVYPTAAAAGTKIVVEVLPKEGGLLRALEFTAQPGWERRYAFDPPFDLAPGTKLQVTGANIVLNVAPSVP